jgi:hypothetical protein
MRLVKLSIFQRIVLVLGIAFFGLAFLPHYFSKLATPDKAFVYLMLLEFISFISACTAIIMFLFYAVLPDPDFKHTCKRWFALTSSQHLVKAKTLANSLMIFQILRIEPAHVVIQHFGKEANGC